MQFDIYTSLENDWNLVVKFLVIGSLTTFLFDRNVLLRQRGKHMLTLYFIYLFLCAFRILVPNVRRQVTYHYAVKRLRMYGTCLTNCLYLIEKHKTLFKKHFIDILKRYFSKKILRDT